MHVVKTCCGKCYSGAGDCLVDLTSREGDWFLDEMYLVSTLVTELSSLLPSHHQLDSLAGADTRVELVLQCLKSAHNIYKGLQVIVMNKSNTH